MSTTMRRIFPGSVLRLCGSTVDLGAVKSARIRYVTFAEPESSNAVPQFRVSIVHADGRRTERLVTGGTSVQHSIDAMDEAGLGGVARVAPAGWVTP